MSAEARFRGPRRKLGVLAVQGAFELHATILSERGHDVRLVRAADDFAGLEGLVLPGGESTVQLELIERFDLEAPLVRLLRSGHPVLATCAGLILIAQNVSGPAQRGFGVLDVDVARNAFGRQLESFEAVSDEPPSLAPETSGRSELEQHLPLVFIRAPRITRVGPTVEVLARYRGEPVLVRDDRVTAGSFHPELTSDTRVHAAVFG